MAKAVKLLNGAYRDGALHADLLHAFEHCNDKVGKSGQAKPLNLRNVQRWKAQREKHGHCLPKVTRKQAEWNEFWFMPLFLAYYRKPQKPQISEAYRAFAFDLKAQGHDNPPSHHAIRKALKMVPEVVLETGRSSGSDLKALKIFVRRDWSGPSNQVWMGDGHTFKAKVRHPETGRAFAPEVTVVIDAASRFIVGWAFSLSENQIAVSEALGMAMMKHGKPLIYYSDNGSGQTAKTIDCPAGGMLARLGVHHATGIPGNPQGRGLIEGMWDITTIAVAKTLPTFQGTGMDGGELRKITQAIDKAKRQGDVPEFVVPWAEFMRLCEERFDWYNTQHQHLSLGGKTPAEVYHENLNAEWAVKLTEHEIATLYRPSVVRKPIRGEVRFLNNLYFHPDLANLPEDAQVRVHFDMHDARQVWVTDLEGAAICVAEFEGNKRAGMPVSLTDHLKDKRMDGIIKKAEGKIENAKAERDGILEGEFSRLEAISAETLPGTKGLAEKVEAQLNAVPEVQPEKPAVRGGKTFTEMAPAIPQDQHERYLFWREWHNKAQDGANIPEDLRLFLDSFPKSSAYRAWNAFYNPEQQQEAK